MKTIFYLTGDRHTFKPVRAGSNLPDNKAFELVRKLKAEGKIVFCHNAGTEMKSANDFTDQNTRDKYWSQIIEEYFK